MKILTPFALLVIGAGLASADILVTTNAATVGPQNTDFDFSLVFPATATPAGYHLVGATLEVFASIQDSNLTLTNNASTNQSFRFTATAEADITDNPVDETFMGMATDPITVVTTGPARVTFTPHQTHNYGPITLNETLGATAVTNPAGYLAGDTLTGFTASGITFIGGGGNIGLTQVQTATIDGTLIFDFAENVVGLPEPATMVLFGSALIGLGLLRKRIRK